MQAENTNRMRPVKDVVQHITKLKRGPKATLRSPKKKSQGREKNHPMISNDVPPPLTLAEVHKSVLIVDKSGEWMRGWKDNFSSLRIKNLRSLMNAHTDPFDHRSLEHFAKLKGRGGELVTLPSLMQRDSDFTGPYQVCVSTPFSHLPFVCANQLFTKPFNNLGTKHICIQRFS